MALGFYRTPEQFAESSGRINERFVFGEARIHDPAYEREKNTLIQHYRDLKKSVPFREALEVVKHFQPLKPDSREPVDPASPVKQFPYALRKYVVDGLGLKGEKARRVFFWTTVGSFVDKEFGADAVIEVKGSNGEPPKLIRLDVTLKTPEEAKKQTYSDRVVIYGEIPDVHENKKLYDEKVRAIGEEVIQKLNLPAAAAGK